jgi:hypothetical protein
LGKPDPRYSGSWRTNIGGNDLKYIDDPVLRLKVEYDKLTDKAFSGNLMNGEKKRLLEISRLLKVPR